MIEFSGDPSLNTQKLLNLLEPLKNTKITGNLMLDVSQFNVSPYSPNLMLDDIGSSYAPPVFAAIFDQNIIKFYFSNTYWFKQKYYSKNRNYDWN